MFDFLRNIFKKSDGAEYEADCCRECREDDCYDPCRDRAVELIDIESGKTTLVMRMDKVYLVKPYAAGRFGNVGAEEYEIANILDDGSFVIRRAVDRVAIGVVPVKDFFEHFCPVREASWTPWMPFADVIDGEVVSVGTYRTNFKKVQVRLLDDTRGEASCNTNMDQFDFRIGLSIAYNRAKSKVAIKKYQDAVKEINQITNEIQAIMGQVKSK